MNIPRYNNFKVILPDNILPSWIKAAFTDILKDAGLLKAYNGNPVNAIIESVTGWESPGKHLNLSEQKAQDATGTTYISRFYPKGTNAMRTIDDDEFALTFRHVDGFFNYHMLELAIQYMADDNAQRAQEEVYKRLGTLTFIEFITENWKLVNMYDGVVFRAIDGNSFKYSEGPSEKTFTVRFKFTSYRTEMYFKDTLIQSIRYYNNPKGN